MPFIQMVRQLSSDMKPKCETFLNESKELLRIGWILSIFMLLEYMLTSTSVIFCGQIGKTEMAAAGLAQSIISIFCFMPGYGMVTVCNTYFSAGFASQDNSRQGIILQKALLLSCIVTLPCWGILINTESMLRLLHQKEDISLLVGVFLRIYLPAVPALFAAFVLSRFLQCRNHVMITMLAMLFSVITNFVLNYVFIIVMHRDVRWSAGSLTISLYVYLLILSVYIYMYENMEGWSIKSLDDWYEFSAIGTHGCLMVELEILIFEAGYFFCGTLGEMEVDVFGAVYILIFYTFMICSGVASALAIRIGQSLEVNGIDQAKKSAKVGFVISWIYGAVVSVFFLVFHNYVGYVFTTDKKVVEQISSIVPMLITFEMSDLTSNIGKGILQGCGRQSAGALAAFISYYFIGLPVCIYLVFVSGYGAKGMWIGLCVGNGTQAIGLLLYTVNIDWESEAILCQERNRDNSEEDGVLIEAKEDSVVSDSTDKSSDESGTSSKGSDKSKSSEKSRKNYEGNKRPKNIEEGRRNHELTPLVEKSEFRLSRETIYMRIVNVTVAAIICFAGVAYYVIGLS